MQLFHYQCVNSEGRNISGSATAIDEATLEQKLRQSGLWLVEARAQQSEAAKNTRFSFMKRFGVAKRRELIDFCTLMCFQVKVGLPIVQAIGMARDDCDNLGFKQVLDEVQHHLEGGLQFYEALEKYPQTFTAQFTSVIRAGELSSNLPEAFDDLKAYLEWVEQVVSDVRQVTIYPSIVLGVVCAFVLFLFTFIIPQFVKLLNAAHVPLPWATKVVFGVSDFAKATWWIWIFGSLSGFIALQLARKYSLKFAISFDRFKFGLPVFGPLNHMLAMSRFAHNLSVLYGSGVNILQALLLTRGLVGSPLISRAIDDIHERVESGDRISEAMRRHPVFPNMLLRMVVMGEATGNLDKSLDNVSHYYNQIIPRRIKKIFSLMEPALILFLVGVVGFVALSIFLPILSLIGSIKS